MLEPAVAGRIVVSTNEDALAVLRRKSMRQALYDAGAPVMADCLLDLHAEAHRDRRRLENRLFRRATFEHFERTVLPAAIASTLAPAITAGSGDLIAIGYRTVMHLTATIAGIDVPPDAVAELEFLTKLFSRGAAAVHDARRPRRARGRGRTEGPRLHHHQLRPRHRHSKCLDMTFQ